MTYNPPGFIPKETMEEFGGQKLQREFSSFVRTKYPSAIVNGWTVTLTITHDGSDTEYLTNKITDQLNNIPKQALSYFS